MTKMQIRVDLPQNAYDIAIAPGSLDTIGEQLQPLHLGKKVLVVSNPSIFKHYGESVQKSLESVGFAVATHLIPPGERYKTLKSIQKVYDTALNNRLERSSTFIALGGGVIGDMT
ncbi:MAG: iron-containing alcohol dehydrogenase, partial [Spirulina sp.]